MIVDIVCLITAPAGFSYPRWVNLLLIRVDQIESLFDAGEPAVEAVEPRVGDLRRLDRIVLLNRTHALLDV